MKWFTIVMLFGAALCWTAFLIVWQRKLFRTLLDQFLALSYFHKAVLVLYVTVTTVCAQKMGNPMLMLTMMLPSSNTVSEIDVARGWKLESVTNRYDISYSMPEGASSLTNWSKRGGYEDVARLSIPSFPLGTKICDYLWIYTWGKVRPTLRNATQEIAAVGAPMSALPRRSQFWYGTDTNKVTLLTWQDFAVGRIPIEGTEPPYTNFEFVSAQIELHPNGDFITRSNDVETVYRRINPDDWDDDGDPNDSDPSPYSYDGDHFGICQELAEEANSNAYCWVDLVVSSANSLVTFTGDGASDLPDPRFIAKAGETNRVILLIGKTYFVNCRMPISIIDKSSAEIEVEGSGGQELMIYWPVDIQAVSGGGSLMMLSGFSLLGAGSGNNSFQMFVSPAFLNGSFVWTNCCCSISGSGNYFTYSCNENCHCGGCCASGYYQYEGYRLPAAGGSCGCTGEDDDDGDEIEQPDHGGAGAYFSPNVAFFEDAYENAPGVTVPRQTTDIELHCYAHGGINGGTVSFEIEGESHLVRKTGRSLPVTQALAPYEPLSFVITYTAGTVSQSKDDIVVTTTFHENGEESPNSPDTTEATVIRLKFEPVIDAPANGSRGRHKLGVCELLECRQYPSLPQVTWNCSGGGSIENYNGADRFICPIFSVIKPLTVQCRSAEYIPNIIVVSPSGIEVRDVTYRKYGVPTNYAGGVALQLPSHALPLDVSFSNVAVEEVPNDYCEKSGYFTNPRLSSLWGHTVNNGAGKWVKVDANNYVGTDSAGITGILHRVTSDEILIDDPQYGWTYGRMIWKAPSGWGRYNSINGDAEYGRFDEERIHEMVIFETGRVGSRKFENTVTRDVDGTINLNGAQMEP